MTGSSSGQVLACASAHTTHVQKKAQPTRMWHWMRSSSESKEAHLLIQLNLLVLQTCDMNTFKYGVGDRGSSIRIPFPVSKAGKGYLEDRRPSANVDPYTVARLLIKTCLQT